MRFKSHAQKKAVMAKLKGYRTIIYNPEGEIMQVMYAKTKKESIKPVTKLNKELGFKLSLLTKYPSKQAVHYGGGYTIRKVYG